MPKPLVRRQSQTGNRHETNGDVVSRIAPMSVEENKIKMLVYGRSKTGKTTFVSTIASQIPAGKKVLWIICSGGNKSGELKSIAAKDRNKIEAVTLQSSLELRTITEHLQGDNSFYAVIQDHVSGLQDRALAEVMKVDQVPAQMSWGTATRDQWMEAGTNCREGLRGLLGLDKHIILLGQERPPKELSDNEELLTPTIGVDLMPSLAGWLYPTVDYIVQTFMKQKVETKEVSIAGKKSTTTRKVAGADYCLRTGPHENYVTGFRVPRGAQLPDYIVDPTFAMVQKIIDGEWEE